MRRFRLPFISALNGKKCADLVILFFMSFCLFLMIQDSDRRSVFAYTSYR